ncbi:hypothetical protein B0H15DRAFT_793917 [Mycena belliarum]|uniref:MYND-type domain-containing protein n=1 Tax=Mycena belliarum TaxID=1033014 RepID=A0AAD6XDU5_9AGAR|nr:hypothetical protein B0H15DRAFT_793917 [Mycena belliae]
MALPLFWPGRYRFYPIGNTSAVSLVRDLAPETDGTILLLGCGDPRNIMYTISCEPEIINRTLDFTCCDMDPAVLARNVILLTLIADNQTSPAVMWNIFYHMRLDPVSLAVLLSQCKKLITIAATVNQWRASPYSHFIRMCTEYTLTELRRHWSLYEGMQNLSLQRMRAIEMRFSESATEATAVNMHTASLSSSARSAGPLMVQALQACGAQLMEYWEVGGSFTSDDEARESKLWNPTFVYSLGGEGCSVNPTTDPIVSFHLASVLGNSKCEPTRTDIVIAAKAQFAVWCSSFHKAVALSPNRRTPVIRFFVGEATTVCHSLRTFATTGALTTGTPIAKWNSNFVVLDQHEYLAGGAPTVFNVIDTSNLDDHVGCLNVMIASVPLLPPSPGYFVLYTESLLFSDKDATKEFADLLHADLATFAHLIGICPVDYLSGFSSRSNVHELILNNAQKKEAAQFHRMTTWKSPSSVNDFGPYRGEKKLLPIFDSEQLGTRLYDMYRHVFEKEEPAYYAKFKYDQAGRNKAISLSNLVTEVRETFVLFLKLVRDKLEIPGPRWSETMRRFFTLLKQEEAALDHYHRYDVYTLAHFHGVHTDDLFNSNVPKLGPMVNWERVPSLVRLIIIVPREKLAVLKTTRGTPLLQCEFKGTGRKTHDIFTSVHAAFGTVIPTGSPARPSVLFREDPNGWTGTSPLIASFLVATQLLAIDALDKIQVSFAVRNTPAVASEFGKGLGTDFFLFTANIMDKNHIYVLPEQPLPTKEPEGLEPSLSNIPSAATGRTPEIGYAGPLTVELDEECELVSRLTCRVSVDSQGAKKIFGSASKPQPGISQRSACVMRLSIGRYTQDITFPFAVIGSQNRLRLARKSMYIEIVLPISGPFRPDGMKLNPFPVIGNNPAFAPWNIHQLNLSRLPSLDTGANNIEKWLKPHLAWMLSARERKLTETHENDVLALVKDTLHTVFRHAAGTSDSGEVRRVFALRDKPSTECDTIIFISDVKFDLAAHTLVSDAYVLPLTPPLMSTIREEFGNLLRRGNIYNVGVYGDEMRAWKQILPAFAERCRTWKHQSNCEYASQQRVPLSVEMHLDPLCSCGRGKDVEGMSKVSLWSKFAPLVTRIAMSPLFAVSYLESVSKDLDAGRCSVCRGKGKPKMKRCAKCQKTRYCSATCQRKDWDGGHKAKCKPWSD